MKTKKKIFISLILVLSILTLNSSPAFSAEVKDIGVDAQPNVDEISDSYVENITTDIATLDISALNKNECMIAEYVNADDFNKSSHVSRLADEEKLDTYVFLNADGTKSVYYMDEKVKFVDKNGDIREKDVSLVSKSDGYGITRNEFDLHLPTNASSGITMSYNGYDVKIIPQTTVKAVPAKTENGSVVYDGFFGTDTSLKYTPTLSGLKEDVVMKAYVPNASFGFILDTDGLELYNKDGEYYLAESESSKALLNLGKVIIYDAVGKPVYGTMTVTTITKNRKYKLSLSAPEEFLKDPSTVYPVTIDPSLTVSDNDTGNGAIADTILFSGKPSSNYGDYKYLSIGYVDSTYGVGRVAVKLPGLYNSSQYVNASAAEILSVKFYCLDSSGNSAQQINLYRLTGIDWDENTVTANSGMSYNTTPNMGTTMSSSTWTAFDITALAKAWKTTFGVVANRGFILINSNETSASCKKAPFSSEYSNSSYRPYVVMVYDPNMSQNYKAVLYGVTNSGHDHISCLNTVSTTMSGIWNNVIVRSGAISASTCRNDLLSTNLFTSRSHGNWVPYSGTETVSSTCIILDDKTSNYVAFYSHSSSSMSSGSTYIQTSDDYTGLNVALFIGCYTAKGGKNARNLPSTIVAHGASASSGFAGTIGCSSANTWTTSFYAKMLQGSTLKEAADYACSFASDSSGLKDIVICGDSSIRLPIY